MKCFRLCLVSGSAAMALLLPLHGRAGHEDGSVALKKPPLFQSIPDARYEMGGEFGSRLAACTERWIIPTPKANPGMLDMFRDSVREHKPFASPEGWAGEFAGKYLTHAAQMYKLTHDERILEVLKPFVEQLASLQDEDGYLGPWPREIRFKPGPWDTWGHYHVMMGLLLWNRQTQDAKALTCACRIADMLCKTFLNVDERKAGLMECEAPIHSLCLLYEKTGKRAYLDLALEIVKEFEQAGDYVRQALAGREFFQGPRVRWETLHPIMGIAELYFITGDEKYREAYEHIWWSILESDRHNNGGFSTGEQATGDPYRYGIIETCCTVAWMAMSVDMLRMTGDSRVADELELSLLNSGLGLMSPDGAWVTYDTPVDGVRKPSTESIGWQGREGTPTLNCCAVNGPRAIAMTGEWALMRNRGGLVLNYYGPSAMATTTAGGNSITLVQETDYPNGNEVDITVNPARPETFTLSLRIPYWSEKTGVNVNGETLAATPGKYLKLTRRWTAGDRLVVEFDFRPHYWVYRPAIEATHWNTKWTLFGPLVDLEKERMAEFEQQLAEATEAIPEALTYTPDDADETDVVFGLRKESMSPKTGVAKNGYIDLVRIVDGRHREQLAYAFAEYNSAVAETVRMTFNVSGQASLYVNGKPVEIGSSGHNPHHARTRKADIPLRQGRNIIAFRIPWVMGVGWFLSAGWERPYAPGVMLTSVYRGPILLTFDPRFNTFDADRMPVLTPTAGLKLITDVCESPKPMVLCETKAGDGRTVKLCDFAIAGATGNRYQSWLNVEFDGDPSKTFSKENPLRSFRR